MILGSKDGGHFGGNLPPVLGFRNGGLNYDVGGGVVVVPYLRWGPTTSWRPKSSRSARRIPQRICPPANLPRVPLPGDGLRCGQRQLRRSILFEMLILGADAPVAKPAPQGASTRPAGGFQPASATSSNSCARTVSRGRTIGSRPPTK